MNKTSGNIGFAIPVETAPDVWVDNIVERHYLFDVEKDYRKLNTPSDKLNRDIDISNQFSILMDPFAVQNFHSIRYVEYMGTKWAVNGVQVLYPRLILNVGGIYHE